MDSMFKFHRFGFTTTAVVSDGTIATSNLSMIKVLSGSEAKAYGYVYAECINSIIIHLLRYSKDAIDKFAIEPWFMSPFTGQCVYFIICPSHQVSLSMTCSIII